MVLSTTRTFIRKHIISLVPTSYFQVYLLVRRKTRKPEARLWYAYGEPLCRSLFALLAPLHWLSKVFQLLLSGSLSGPADPLQLTSDCTHAKQFRASSFLLPPHFLPWFKAQLLLPKKNQSCDLPDGTGHISFLSPVCRSSPHQ